jgi:hypothetical protein
MKDCNFPLQKVYNAMLSGIMYDSVAVPAYFKSLPDNISPNNYIIFDHVSNADNSTINTADSASSVRVTIHTFDNKYNTGKAANNIGGQVLQIIYPNSQAILDLNADNLQMYSTELVTDIMQDYNQASRVYLDRILIFRHRIFHR